MKKTDQLIKRQKGLSNASMKGRNESRIEGDLVKVSKLDEIKEEMNIK